MRPRITNAGIAAQTGALGGVGITFTKIKMGNGAAPADYLVLTDLVNTVVTVPLTHAEASETAGFYEITGEFDNSDLPAGFTWTEVGIFIQDPEDETKDILYAYGHVSFEGGADYASAIPQGGTEIYELELVYQVFVGEAENISAQIAEHSSYASQTDFENHIHDYNNPHRVTATQVGLGNVPNVATNDQTPTFEESPTLINIESGEALSVILGKIKKAISTLIAHIGDAVAHVSDTDRATWNNKANRNHTHAASDINSGVLPINRGGTGVNNIEDLNALFQAPFVIGNFIGDGKYRQDINLGFTPTKVYVVRLLVGGEEHKNSTASSQSPMVDNYAQTKDLQKVSTWYFEPGKNIYHDGCGASYYSVDADTLFAKKHGGMAVIDGGFAVGYPTSSTPSIGNGRYDTNLFNVTYMYIAFR